MIFLQRGGFEVTPLACSQMSITYRVFTAAVSCLGIVCDVLFGSFSKSVNQSVILRCM